MELSDAAMRSPAACGAGLASRGVVLVVDSLPAGERLANGIRALGHDSLRVSRIEDAIERLASIKPLAIVSELVVGGACGFQLLDFVRESSLDVPFVFVSGIASVPAARHALARGARDFLTKPASPSEVLMATPLRPPEVSRFSVDEARGEYAREALETFGSISAAARELGVDRSQFRRLLRRLGIEVELGCLRLRCCAKATSPRIDALGIDGARGEAQAARAASPHESGTFTLRLGSMRRVVIALESRLKRQALVTGFQRVGVEAIECDSVFMARKHCRDAAPDVLVTDLRLCDGPTSSLIQWAKDASIRVVVLTAYESVASAVWCKRLGVDEYLGSDACLAHLVETLLTDASATASSQAGMFAPMSLERAIWEYLNRTVSEEGSISKGAAVLRMERRSLRRMLGKHAPSQTGT
jgi:two-component system response regulator RegA